MILAITYENGNVFGHFGETKEFLVLNIENKTIVDKKIISAGEASHIALIDVIKGFGANALICGGMGNGAYERLKQAGILVYNGVSGSCEEAIAKFLDGKLTFNPNMLHNCSHHH